MEDVELPVKQVDVIVSEWMVGMNDSYLLFLLIALQGYMLLYESMLDSVLTLVYHWAPKMSIDAGSSSARDRFLAPNGLMAPSQTRLVISAITAERVCKQSIDFWYSVYGEKCLVTDALRSRTLMFPLRF